MLPGVLILLQTMQARALALATAPSPQTGHIQRIRGRRMLPAMFPQEPSRESQRYRWFFFAGGIGLAIAIILADLLSHDLMAHDLGSGELLKVLWPSSVVSGAHAATVPAQLLDGLLMYGGQFVLYGLVGLLLASLVRQRRRHRTTRQNRSSPVH